MKKVGIAFTTKDRTDYTRQTLPPIIAEADEFDLHWVDGSATDDGKRFFQTSHPSPLIVERHGDITGGATRAIQYCWATLYNKGYDYIGLIENDVKLKPGWFKKTMALFEKDEAFCDLKHVKINVGAVSARCFTDRIDQKHDGFATMANVGAGMIIVKRELIPWLLLNWRHAMLWEVRDLFKHYTGREYPLPPFVRKDDPETKKDWQFSEDWYFEIAMLAKGFSTLALTPSMAYNLDDSDGFRDPVYKG